MTIQRRSFLIGLGSLLAAPAVVHSSNIMPIKLFNPYYTRYLLDYEIGSDRMAIRVDKALHPLRMSTKWLTIITANETYKFIPKQFIDNIKPKEGEQKYIHRYLTWEEAKSIQHDVRENHD